MVEIVPAILPKSFDDLESKLALMQGEAPLVQVDVVDGVFAPNKTWPYAGGEMFSSILSGDLGLPFWEDIDFQFDCMVSHPEGEIDNFITAGASSVIIHGAGSDIMPLLEKLQPNRANDFGVRVGVALLPGDDAGTFAQYKNLCDFVQVMGISKVGFQGSEFDPRALDLITSLRANNTALTIQIDGGVRLENARALAQAGANTLVVGSAIFGSSDPIVAMRALSKEANK
ncbi:MAG: hypothetical protein V4436_02875 [Patescibacteria group bacterium]